MGYYSDWALALNADARELLDKKLKVMNSEIVSLFTKHYDHFQLDETTGCQLYFWKDVKSTDDEFEFIKLLIYNLEEDQYRFLRLGESYGDIEAEGELECIEFDLSINSAICFNKVTENNDQSQPTKLGETA